MLSGCTGNEGGLSTNRLLFDTDGDGLCDGNATVFTCTGNEGTAGSNPTLTDTDGDGLSDPVEYLTLHTDPANNDTDGDGVPDGIEAPGGSPVNTDGDGFIDALDKDSDGDGLCDGNITLSGCDGNEVTQGSNRLVVDTDGDGLCDGLQTVGACVGAEMAAGTNANNPDTDGDFINDRIEFLVGGTNPHDDDTDDDGIIDGNEDINRNGFVDPGETDPNDNDSDDDGLIDGLEISLTAPQGHDTNLLNYVPDVDPLTHTNPLDDDSDNDGLVDGTEDGNRNGRLDAFGAQPETDPANPDTDGDFIQDGTEQGLTAPQGTGTLLAFFIPDADPATRTDPLNPDTDGGSVVDGIEDFNHNGKIDYSETDPLLAADDLDSDLDGISDAVELATCYDPAETPAVDLVCMDPRDNDTDNDGVPDLEDGLTDTDGDGIPDALDPDSDNDGVLDGTELGVTPDTAPTGTDQTSRNFVPDSDPTTTTDPKVRDTDGDGATDGEEDRNRNGLIDKGETDPNNPDTDADGLPDGIEMFGENPTNPLKPDTDGDGLKDGDEDKNHNGAVDPGETDPNKWDTDGDTLGDGAEVHGGTNPLKPQDGLIFEGSGGCVAGGRTDTGWVLMLIVCAGLFARRRLQRRSPVSGAGPLAGLLLVFAALWAPGTASAQLNRNFEVQQFRPGPGSQDILGVQSTRTLSHLGWGTGMYLNYAHDPLRMVSPLLGGDSTIDIVGNHIAFDFMGSFGLWDSFEMGLVLPLSADLDSDITPSAGPLVIPPKSHAGLGDARLSGKYRFLDTGDFHMAAGLLVGLPTGTKNSFMSQKFATFEPELMAEYDRPDTFRTSFNLSFPIRGNRHYGDVTVKDAFRWGLGAEVPFLVKEEKLAIIATATGETEFKGLDAPDYPIELLGGLRWYPVKGFNSTLAAGRGVTDGYGSPDFRILWTIAYGTPPPEKAPLAPPVFRGTIQDEEGKVLAGTVEVKQGDKQIGQSADNPFKFTLEPGQYAATATSPGYQPESVFVAAVAGEEAVHDFKLKLVPPNPGFVRANIYLPDGVTVPVTVSVTQEGKSLESRRVDGYVTFALDPGKYTVTADALQLGNQTRDIEVKSDQTEHLDFIFKAIIPGRVKIVTVDTEGTPVQAHLTAVQGGQTKESRDTVNGLSEITFEEGAYQIVAAVPNQPAQSQDVKVANETVQEVKFVFAAPPKEPVKIGNKIEIIGKINFATNKAVILPKSYPVVDQVYTIMSGNAAIRLVEIQGHTDSMGDAAKNKDLSQRRADAVREYLIKKGIEPGRMTAVGYGEEVPLFDPDDNEEKRAANRRVEFLVKEAE